MHKNIKGLILIPVVALTFACNKPIYHTITITGTKVTFDKTTDTTQQGVDYVFKIHKDKGYEPDLDLTTVSIDKEGEKTYPEGAYWHIKDDNFTVKGEIITRNLYVNVVCVLQDYMVTIVNYGNYKNINSGYSRDVETSLTFDVEANDPSKQPTKKDEIKVEPNVEFSYELVNKKYVFTIPVGQIYQNLVVTLP